MKRIFMATKNVNFVNKIRSEAERGYEVVGTCDSRDNLLSAVTVNNNVDILIVSFDLSEDKPLEPLLLNIKDANPYIRIIYMAGSYDKEDAYTIKRLCSLVDNGIYDIISGRSFSMSSLYSLIDSAQTKRDVGYLYEYMKSIENAQGIDIFKDTKDPAFIDEERNNLVAISSCKPGSGKSFVSSNIAVMIAKFGEAKEDRELPKVLLVDADLQTLSIGTLFGKNDPQFGIKPALNKISRIVNENGEIVSTKEQRLSVDEFILECCTKSAIADNLYTMTGTNLTIDEMRSISPYHFYYLLSVIAEHFDVVIIDTNSSLEHLTSEVSFQLSKHCYMVINPDQNSISINNGKRNNLEQLGLATKLQYIVNRYTLSEKCAENEQFISDNYNVIARIPEVDEGIFCNCIYNHTPIACDKTQYTLSARIAFWQIANQIWNLENANEILDEIKKTKDNQ